MPTPLQALLDACALEVRNQHRLALAAIGRLRRLLDLLGAAWLVVDGPWVPGQPLGASSLRPGPWDLEEATMAAASALQAHLWMAASRHQVELALWVPGERRLAALLAASCWADGEAQRIELRYGRSWEGWQTWVDALRRDAGACGVPPEKQRAWAGAALPEVVRATRAAGLDAVVALLERDQLVAPHQALAGVEGGGLIPVVRCDDADLDDAVAAAAALGWEPVAIRSGMGVEARLFAALELAVQRGLAAHAGEHEGGPAEELTALSPAPPLALVWSMPRALGVPAGLLDPAVMDQAAEERARLVESWLASYRPERLLDEVGAPTTFARDAAREDQRRARMLADGAGPATSLGSSHSDLLSAPGDIEERRAQASPSACLLRAMRRVEVP